MSGRGSEDATQALGVVNVFCVASGLETLRSAALRLGYNSTYFLHLASSGTITAQQKRELFKRLAQHWPKGQEMSAPLARWIKANGHLLGGAGPDKRAKVRKCMACNERFLSEGSHHRLCAKHRAGSTFDDLSVAMPDARG